MRLFRDSSARVRRAQLNAQDDPLVVPYVNRNLPEKRAETAVGSAMRRGERQLPNQLRCGAERPLFFLSTVRARHCDRAPEKESANSGFDLTAKRGLQKRQ